MQNYRLIIMVVKKNHPHSGHYQSNSVAKGSLHLEAFICVPSREAPTLPSVTFRLIPDWATILWKTHLQSGNYHPQGLSRLSNYRLKDSSLTGQLPGLSPIGQLPPEGPSPTKVLHLFVHSKEKNPYSRIIEQTSISGFSRIILIWAIAPERLILNWATAYPAP